MEKSNQFIGNNLLAGTASGTLIKNVYKLGPAGIP
jgi:hypothetical protein